MGICCCKEEEIDFNAEVELSHFHLLRSVGKGAFGKVRVVQHKHTKVLYALKYINKAKCIKMRAIENIIQERRLLEEIDYPLVCNLRYAFQDDDNMFMVLDLMLGGDLRFHLERQGSMKEEVVKFYAAEISLGLAYLHSKKIVHRDLKPDNILLDEKGHAHLTDFNIAVHFNEKKPLTSVAGSMAYMAPEVLSKKGYFDSVDWWSLGILIYELLFSIDWDMLATKQANAPFIPDPKRANFDATHELEELLLEDNPLKAKKRANPNQDLSGLSREVRMMEEKFLIYDFTKMCRRGYSNHNRATSAEKRSSQVTRRKSESRSSGGSSTAIDHMTINSSNINPNFSMDTNASLLPTRPPSAKLAHMRTESDLTTAGLSEELKEHKDNKEKTKGDWLSERPTSSQNRDVGKMSGFVLGAVPINGRSSPIVASNDSDGFPMRPHLSGYVSPSPSVSTLVNHKRGSSFSSPMHATSSLTPPPRIQQTSKKVYNTVTPPSSRPTSPNPHPSISVRSPPQQASHSPDSLNVSSVEEHPLVSQPLTLHQVPPNSISLLSANVIDDACNHSARVRSLSPPSTNRRIESSSNNRRMWEKNGDQYDGHSTSGTSAGSGFSSENSNGGGVGHLKGHYRNASDLSLESEDISVVDVTTGI
ncbi:6229_t:CDS:2 [Acaulospora colombiana]|uniref:6229_t:CDS:1 n=1 Tax=Acaulospora colombiana TaxID=27376 RepID=A0ACA9JV23_9GLOM|nr:6229_t:CDS:2 [Acaulospora colombiana]